MILYNHTKIPDDILTKVLYLAAKAVGSIRTQKVVIKVTTSSQYCSGRCHKLGLMYYHGFLRGSWDYDYSNSEYNKKSDRKLIPTDGGYMFLQIPVTTKWSRYSDPLDLAERIFALAAHEWQHIKDYQKKVKFGNYERNWKNRPHERRAITAAKRADRVKDKRTDIQDAILNLGFAIENIRS